MNRYTYRDIFSSHKVAGPAVSPQAAAQAKKTAEAEKTKKAKEAKAKAKAEVLDSLANEIERLITAFEPFRTGRKTEASESKKIKDPADLRSEISDRIEKLTLMLKENRTIIDSGAYNKIVGRLNNFNTGLATIQKTLKQIDEVKARALKEKQARQANAATAKK